jgi:hypothetical protein
MSKSTQAILVDDEADEAWINAITMIRARLWGCIDEGRVTPEALALAMELSDALAAAVAEAEGT